MWGGVGGVRGVCGCVRGCVAVRAVCTRDDVSDVSDDDGDV